MSGSQRNTSLVNPADLDRAPLPFDRKPRPGFDERSEPIAADPAKSVPQIVAAEPAGTYTVRARPRGERLISSTVRLPLWMMEELERLHAEEGLEKSTVVRAALEAHLRRAQA